MIDMTDLLSQISDLTKFIIMLVIYTGYMTWWAAGISHDLEVVILHVASHGEHTEDPVQQTLAIHSLMIQQDKISKILENNTVQHARCTVIMENMMRRLERLEGFENAEHVREEEKN